MLYRCRQVPHRGRGPAGRSTTWAFNVDTPAPHQSQNRPCSFNNSSSCRRVTVPPPDDGRERPGRPGRGKSRRPSPTWRAPEGRRRSGLPAPRGAGRRTGVRTRDRRQPFGSTTIHANVRTRERQSQGPRSGFYASPRRRFRTSSALAFQSSRFRQRAFAAFRPRTVAAVSPFPVSSDGSSNCPKCRAIAWAV